MTNTTTVCGAAPDPDDDDQAVHDAREMDLTCSREAGHIGPHGAEITHYWGAPVLPVGGWAAVGL